MEDVFEVPLDFILDPDNHLPRERHFAGQTVMTYDIVYGGRQIWGATANMLHHAVPPVAGEHAHEQPRATARDHGPACAIRKPAAHGTSPRIGKSIAPHTIEEAYEVADAVQRGDPAAVRDELGDLLFQVVFQARIAQEQQHFDFDAVAAPIADKLERRHPHVFGDVQIADAAEQSRAWERYKQDERGRAGEGAGALDGVALGLAGAHSRHEARLPGRPRGLRLDGSRWRAGEDRRRGARAARRPSRGRTATRFALKWATCCSAWRNLRGTSAIDAEGALREANAKFERRFRHMEAALAAAGQECGASGCGGTRIALAAGQARARLTADA